MQCVAVVALALDLHASLTGETQPVGMQTLTRVALLVRDPEVRLVLHYMC